jgi:uncharacterized pyridoxamine 5'-phosphate oxidase family protein
MRIHDDIIHFLCTQGYVILSTIDEKGHIHCSAKGIVGIEQDKVYIIDLFKNQTYRNLQKDDRISITAVNEHQFKGFTLQGHGKIIMHKDIEDHIVKKWEDKVIKRISARMIRGVQKGVKSVKHHEAHLPDLPKYLIEVDVDNIIDLAPPACKERHQQRGDHA